MKIALFLTTIALLASGLRAEHTDFVVISANASKGYTQRRLVDGSPRPESYIFYQGQYFGGATRDPSIARASFAAISKTLAPDLAKQNYLPLRTGRFTDADLLIVIDWGTTVTDPMNDSTNMETQSQLADLVSAIHSYSSNSGGATMDASPSAGLMHGFSDVGAQLSALNANEQSQGSIVNMNSHLLGYDATLQKESRMAWATPNGMTSAEETHLSQLVDERYFVILMAYDYQRILRDKADYQQRLRDYRLQQANAAYISRRAVPPAPRPPPQPKPVWIVRMNVRAAGNNFVQALPAMSQAASSYFGKQLDDLVTAQTAIGSHARVDVGEPRAMNVVK